MASLNAKLVADKVKKQVSKGELVNVSKAMREVGYSETSVRVQKVRDMKAYKAEIAPYIQNMIFERDESLERMSKTRNKAKYRDLAYGVDILTKNIQLLGGHATERNEIIPLIPIDRLHR